MILCCLCRVTNAAASVASSPSSTVALFRGFCAKALSSSATTQPTPFPRGLNSHARPTTFLRSSLHTDGTAGAGAERDDDDDDDDDSELINASLRPSQRPRRKNLALEAVKEAGLPHLEATAKEVASKTRRRLLEAEDDTGPSVNQLREAHRVESVLTEALERFAQRDSTFSIGGDPIVILDVEVSPDLRQARVYWTLPYTLLGWKDDKAREATRRMQLILDRKGGKLQALVHSKLRAYYPPRLKFVPAENSLLLTEALRDLIQFK